MTAPQSTFPLVPRFRLLGIAFGAIHSARRGLGSDIAGSRPYVAGDDMKAIDWNASARRSTARDSDDFIVRERFADEAPRVVAFCDRRPAMGLYPSGLPWLRKAEAMRVATGLVAASAFRARGLFGYLDFADAEEPYWTPPGSEPQWHAVEDEFDARGFSAETDNVTRGLEWLRLARIALPAGSFVFVISDFLVPPRPEDWLPALEHRWDIVPVVVQDLIWEQSFPDISGVTVPVVDAETGKRGTLRLTRSRAHELREAHERRHRDLLEEFATLGLEPVVVESAEEEAVLQSFLVWSDRRLEFRHQWATVA